MSPATASRHRLLRKLLTAETVSSQQELVSLLAARGHLVTQATVSRDLVALGAVKRRTAEGSVRYRIRSATSDGSADMIALGRVLAGFVEAITPSGNLVVMKTPPGAAQVVAGAIDRASPNGVIGTVAGDDTVLVIADVDTGGGPVAAELEEMGAGQ